MSDKTAIITTKGFCSRAAVFDDDLLDFAIKAQDSTDKPKLFDVYLCKVIRTMPSLQGAFVDIGTRFAFWTCGKDLPSEGNIEILQVAQEEFGTKEAKLTRDICLNGYYLKYYPLQNNSVATEKDVPAEKRGIVQSLGLKGRWILKRYFKGAEDNIKKEATVLFSRYSSIISESSVESTPRVLFSAGDKFDNFLKDISVKKVLTDDEQVYENVKNIDPSVEVEMADMKAFFNFDERVKSILSPRVTLPSGADITIEETEACVVVDVNSGNQNNGNKAVNSLAVNIEAAKALCAQLRYRNLGGSILVDFITLKDADAKKRLYDAFCEEAKKDCTPIKIYDAYTRLGFLEASRKRLYTPTFIPCEYFAVWKLRKALASIMALSPKQVLVSYPLRLKEFAEDRYLADFPVSIIWKEAEVEDFVMQIL